MFASRVGYGAYGGTYSGGCGCYSEPVPVCPTVPVGSGFGGFGAGIIGIAVLILIALGVIF